MNIAVYQEAKSLRDRIDQIDKVVRLLDTHKYNEVSLTVTMNNFNETLSLTPNEVSEVKTLLEEELTTKRQEFENL